MAAKTPTFVELYAGLASVSLYLCGGKPPVSRIGAKTGYARAIAKTLGVEPGQIRKFLLVDRDPSVCEVLEVLTSGKVDGVIKHLRRWKQDRKTWEFLRGSKFHGDHEAARWLFVTAASRGGIGGFKGKHKLRPSVDGFIPTIDSLCKRLDRLDLGGARFRVKCARAEDIKPFDNAIVYLDPPYQGRQAYLSPVGARAAMSEGVMTLPTQVFERWRLAGARVAMSEGAKLEIDGARVVNISKRRVGQSRRSMTRSTRELLYVASS